MIIVITLVTAPTQLGSASDEPRFSNTLAEGINDAADLLRICSHNGRLDIMETVGQIEGEGYAAIVMIGVFSEAVRVAFSARSEGLHQGAVLLLESDMFAGNPGAPYDTSFFGISKVPTTGACGMHLGYVRDHLTQQDTFKLRVQWMGMDGQAVECDGPCILDLDGDEVAFVPTPSYFSNYAAEIHHRDFTGTILLDVPDSGTKTEKENWWSTGVRLHYTTYAGPEFSQDGFPVHGLTGGFIRQHYQDEPPFFIDQEPPYPDEEVQEFADTLIGCHMALEDAFWRNDFRPLPPAACPSPL